MGNCHKISRHPWGAIGGMPGMWSISICEWLAQVGHCYCLHLPNETYLRLLAMQVMCPILLLNTTCSDFELGYKCWFYFSKRVHPLHPTPGWWDSIIWCFGKNKLNSIIYVVNNVLAIKVKTDRKVTVSYSLGDV